MSFKKFLEEEEAAGTTSGDIATVDTKLGMSRRKQVKGKKCKAHKRPNCEECAEMRESH